MANSVFSFIQFTGEFSVEEQPIPCLDMEVWVGSEGCKGAWYESTAKGAEEIIPGRQETDQHKQVMYKFYKKPMAATLTMLARSPLPENSKVFTASSEIQRRLKRSSLHLS